MRDFAQEGIDVCLTRANYRTGHLEISAYLSFPDQAFHQVIQGALDIQGAAIQSNDAVVVITINTFGKHTVKLGDTLLVMLELYRETLSPLDES